MPDLCHDHLVGFLREHRKGPFFVYYPMSHVHGDLQPVPGGAASSQDLMADNVAYMDTLVGRLVAELESLKLRDNTLLIFMGDNGTGKGQADRATIGGRALSGSKGTMLEGGGLVPLIANWPGKTPTGVVCGDLVDSTDFIPTFASLLGTSLPPGVTFDGQNIVPKLLGQAGKNRDWIFNQLARMWYVRDDQWKLNEQGQLFDMSDAPFAEKLVATDSDASRAARLKLGVALAKLNPAGGIVDGGDGSGRHASKMKKKAEAALATPDDERGEKFDKIDTTKAGKISRDAFISSQSDAEGAAKRFDKYDVNGDGMLSRDEFVSRGSK